MTIKELWDVSPQSFVFIRLGEKRVEHYTGPSGFRKCYNEKKVTRVTAKSYPNFKSVLEVELEGVYETEWF